MEQQILEILSKINSPELQASPFVLWIKVLFLIVSAFFVWAIVISLLKTPYIQLSVAGDAAEVLTYRPFGFPKLRRRWQKIMKRLDSGTEAEYKLAVIEADTLLGESLSRMRIKGESVDEQLEKVTPFMLDNLAELKTAHQARNSIVYDPDYRLGLSEARGILQVYQKSFENLDLFR